MDGPLTYIEAILKLIKPRNEHSLKIGRVGLGMAYSQRPVHDNL